MLERLDAAGIRRWAELGLEALGRHRAEIDALNVFPVPDGDTGTNMSLTMDAVMGEITNSIAMAMSGTVHSADLR